MDLAVHELGEARLGLELCWRSRRLGKGRKVRIRWWHERHDRVRALRAPNEDFIHAHRAHVRVLGTKDLLYLRQDTDRGVAPVIILYSEDVDAPSVAVERPAAEDLELVPLDIDAHIVKRFA